MYRYSPRAYRRVYLDLVKLSRDTFKEDAYAAHVTLKAKRDALARGLRRARRVRDGHVDSMTIAQRLHHAETGECVPLLMPDLLKQKV